MSYPHSKFEYFKAPFILAASSQARLNCL